jgi:hypothetical protein
LCLLGALRGFTALGAMSAGGARASSALASLGRRLGAISARARRLSASSKPLDGRRQAEQMTPEQIEELSVFRATGGLVAAAVGGIGVFVIGAGATLGVASGAASLLGHSMNSKVIPRGDGGSDAREPTREELLAELEALRRLPRSRDVDEKKRGVKKALRA